MRIGIFGTGMVGRAFAGRLVEIGHEVRMGGRTASSTAGTFADAAAFGELLINATHGTASVNAIGTADPGDLAGKVLLDVANPLDTFQGTPVLAFCNTDSLGERIRRAFPEARVVKAFNTMNCEVMVDPGRLSQPTTLPMCGEDGEAKDAVRRLARSLGWADEDILDVGGIRSARGLEMYFAFWVAAYQATGDLHLNVRVVRS